MRQPKVEEQLNFPTTTKLMRKKAMWSNRLLFSNSEKEELSPMLGNSNFSAPPESNRSYSNLALAGKVMISMMSPQDGQFLATASSKESCLERTFSNAVFEISFLKRDTSITDLGPFSLDSFKNNNMSASWQGIEVDTSTKFRGLPSLRINPSAKITAASNHEGWSLPPPRSDRTVDLHVHLTSVSPPCFVSADDEHVWCVANAELIDTTKHMLEGRRSMKKC